MLVSEKRLAVACAIFAVAGIVALYAISLITSPAQMSVSNAMAYGCSKMTMTTGQKMSVSGFIESVEMKDNYAVITIAGGETIEAVSFDSDKVMKMNLSRFQQVEITGELRSYKGRASLIISKLRASSPISKESRE